MLVRLTLTSLSAALWVVTSRAQSTQTATCDIGFDWAFNSAGDSPCEIAGELVSICTGRPYIYDALPPGYYYSGPTAITQNACLCNTVQYSLAAACGLCQSRTIVSYANYTDDCTSTAAPGRFPRDLPSGLAVPAYAYLPLSSTGSFDSVAAQVAGGVDSTRALPTTTSSRTTSRITTTGTRSPGPTPTDDNIIDNGVVKTAKKIAIGVIIAIAVGGFIVVALIATALFCLCRRLRRPQTAVAPVIMTAPGMHEAKAPFLSNDHNSPHMSYQPMAPSTVSEYKYYDPTDPSTYPATPAPPSESAYTGMTAPSTLSYYDPTTPPPGSQPPQNWSPQPYPPASPPASFPPQPSAGYSYPAQNYPAPAPATQYKGMPEV